MTTERKTINVHFIDLYTEDENDDLSTINYESNIGLSFQTLQYSYLENSMDREAWRATVHWVAKSWT